MSRPTWDEFFLALAVAYSRRATCPRASVGAVLVRDNIQIAAGYNGAARGLPHCTERGCEMRDRHCVSAVHAERNALASAAREGHRVVGCALYCTHLPCWLCFQLLINAGIVRVVYGESYRPDPLVIEAAERLGIPLVGMSGAAGGGA